MPVRNQGRIRKPRSRRKSSYEEVVGHVHTLLSPAHVDDLRRTSGYNPRQRVATAHRLLLTCVEGVLSGQSLGFAPLRAFFMKRFGLIRPRAFQLRFKSASAVRFFEQALSHLVSQVLQEFAPPLEKALCGFSDVHVYDGSHQRAPARARAQGLRATTESAGGAKWIVGYSLRQGAAFHAAGGSGCASENKSFWKLVGTLQNNVLYLVDLAYFSRDIFAQSLAQGAFVLMRLKACDKIRGTLQVVHAVENGVPYKPRKLTRIDGYIRRATRQQMKTIDVDIHWGVSAQPLVLRCVGVYLRKTGWRLYLTTVPRERLGPEQIAEAYRLRWLIEFLFREWKQQFDWGRSATADKNALFALTYAALFAHALIRSMRIASALRHEVPLEKIRPIASLHALRACAAELISAALAKDNDTWFRCCENLDRVLFNLALEKKPSRSRPRIAADLGACGA